MLWALLGDSWDGAGGGRSGGWSWMWGIGVDLFGELGASFGQVEDLFLHFHLVVLDVLEAREPDIDRLVR